MNALAFLLAIGAFGAIVYWFVRNEIAHADGVLGFLKLREASSEVEPAPEAQLATDEAGEPAAPEGKYRSRKTPVGKYRQKAQRAFRRRGAGSDTSGD